MDGYHQGYFLHHYWYTSYVTILFPLISNKFSSRRITRRNSSNCLGFSTGLFKQLAVLCIFCLVPSPIFKGYCLSFYRDCPKLARICSSLSCQVFTVSIVLDFWSLVGVFFTSHQLLNGRNIGLFEGERFLGDISVEGSLAHQSHYQPICYLVVKRIAAVKVGSFGTFRLYTLFAAKDHCLGSEYVSASLVDGIRTPNRSFRAFLAARRWTSCCVLRLTAHVAPLLTS